MVGEIDLEKIVIDSFLSAISEEKNMKTKEKNPIEELGRCLIN